MTSVLIVEDEQAIRRFLRTALEAEDLRVFDAPTLQRGLLEAATRKPDLIILDLGLPDGDGLDFIRDIRQWSPVPMIVLSARSEESDKIAALDAGAPRGAAARQHLSGLQPQPGPERECLTDDQHLSLHVLLCRGSNLCRCVLRRHPSLKWRGRSPAISQFADAIPRST